MAWFSAGCDEYSARRNAKKGNQLHDEEKLAEAAKAYEAALVRSPDLTVAHRNLGITYYKMFRVGDTTEANKEVARKAAEHLQVFLERSPNDKTAAEVRDMITKLWTGVGDYDKAMGYWTAELEKSPGNRDILRQLARIAYLAGRYTDAVGWFVKLAEASTKPDGSADIPAQVTAYAFIGRLVDVHARDFEKVYGDARIADLDLAIGYLMKAVALDARSVEVMGSLGRTYGYRAMSHGPSWANAIDNVESEAYMAQWRVLFSEAAKARAKTQPPAEGTPAGKN